MLSSAAVKIPGPGPPTPGPGAASRSAGGKLYPGATQPTDMIVRQLMTTHPKQRIDIGNPPVRYTPVVRHRLTDLQAILASQCIVISVP